MANPSRRLLNRDEKKEKVRHVDVIIENYVAFFPEYFAPSPFCSYMESTAYIFSTFYHGVDTDINIISVSLGEDSKYRNSLILYIFKYIAILYL